MKVAFVLPAGGRSGAVRSTVTTGNELIRRGHEVRILYRRKKQSAAAKAKRQLERLLYGGSEDWISDFAGTAKGVEGIGDADFSGGEVLVAVASWAAVQVGRLKGPFEARAHMIHGALPETDRDLDEAMGLPLHKIVVASYLADFAKERYGRDVIGIVPNGVDTKEYYPPASDENRSGVGAVYADTKAKAPEILAAVLERLAQEAPEAPQYVFGVRPRAKELAHAKYCALPTVERARELYGRAKAWICASASEGFGLPILEAMACGCVVVSTDCGGPRDIIEHGANGFLVPVGDVDAMVRTVKAVLADDELQKRIRSRAAETVRRFSWEEAGAKLEKCLVEAAARGDLAGGARRSS